MPGELNRIAKSDGPQEPPGRTGDQAPRDRASGTNGATDVPEVGQHGGTQRPGSGPVMAWPVTTGAGSGCEV